jgi:hypothetical protein
MASEATRQRLAAADELIKAACIQVEDGVVQVATQSLQEMKGIKGSVDSKGDAVVQSLSALKELCGANNIALITSVNSLKAAIEAQTKVMEDQTKVMEAQNRIIVCQAAIRTLERINNRLGVPESFHFFLTSSRQCERSDEFAKTLLFGFISGSGCYIHGRSTDGNKSKAGQQDFRERIKKQLEALTGMTHRIGLSDGKYAIWYS